MSKIISGKTQNKTENKEIVIKFNYDTEQIKFQDGIVILAIRNEGIIFSDFVLEEISRGFEEDSSSVSDSKTISKQMDILFKNEENFEEFKKDLKGNNIDIVQRYKNYNYEDGDRLIRMIENEYILDKQIRIADYVISFSIKIKVHISDYMPLSNDFKENNFIINSEGIMLRNDHALGLLSLRDAEPRKTIPVQIRLYENIKNKKLTLVKNSGNHYSILKKIAKFMENGWDVDISVFDFFEKIKNNDDKDDKDDKNKKACLGCYKEEEEMYRFNKCFYCKECFIKFLNNEKVEIVEKFETENGSIKKSKKINRIKCPYREYFEI